MSLPGFELLNEKNEKKARKKARADAARKIRFDRALRGGGSDGRGIKSGRSGTILTGGILSQTSQTTGGSALLGGGGGAGAGN